MKQRKNALKICLTCLLFILLTGCGQEKTVQQEQIPVPEEYQLEDHSIPDWKRGAKKKGKEEKKEKPKKTFDPMKISKGDLEKNFEEVMKHVTICGKKVSFPLILKKLGKEFTIKKSSYQPRGNDIMADLYYKGERIADVWIDDGKKGKIKEKIISKIDFCKRDSNLQLDICGVNFETPLEYIYELWGEGKDGIYHKDSNDKSGKSIWLTGTEDSCPYWIDIFYRIGSRNLEPADQDSSVG